MYHKMISVFSKTMHNGNRSFLQVQNHNQSYVIGFEKLEVASKVYNKLQPQVIENIFLLRSMRANISEEVNDELDRYGLSDFKVRELTIDVEAKLVIPKLRNVRNKNKPYDLCSMDKSQFLMMPFENYIGVVLAGDVENETSSIISIDCQVIDPCENFHLFKSALSLQ